MGSRLARLAQGATVREAAPGPAAAPVEQCDLCAAVVPPAHRHLVDVNDRRLLCACRPCALLFDSEAAGGGHLRLVPTRRRKLEGFVLDDAQWERLRIPVEMAFFFHSTPAERVSAFYPSPAGPTECLLELEAWTELESANPVLSEMTPDVEALLVNRARGTRDHWLVPIDDCYELVGLIRTRWRGFGGGEEVWAGIDGFFEDLPTRERTRW
ncbi:MAG: Uncharacterized protein MSMEG_2717 [uncultured Solirubrobacteraceae bacterium]|uniref:Uncharacterized protein MSMEG_2717 n=1 Tax=uncultured Solirubrobacteraceae bacterium TaxID=1162706 RepID=A0A6J4TAQ3_9ACTN|nr:MAG: Uncharacterized protein MSMEG_2717 [uncultured Solirubrobacteraceae bacterium]